MSLWNRLNTLFRADAHGVVDALEDRRLVLRQCLREAEEALAGQRARHAALVGESRQLQEEKTRLQIAATQLDADIELALGKDQDELARFSARKLLQLRGDLERTADRLEAAQREATELAATLERRESELSSLKVRVREASEREERREALGDEALVADEEVELELLRRRTAQEGAS